MKPEELKVIAEGMGYKIAYIVNDWVMCEAMGGMIFNYTPHLTNNDQCMEIMERLSVSTSCTDSGVRLAYIGTDDAGLGFPTASGRGKTINEAVCSAAYEYFKDK